MNDINKDNIQEKFVQWMKSKGRTKSGLVDVIVKDGDSFKMEKRDGKSIDITADDWKEFCDENGVEYDKLELIALC